MYTTTAKLYFNKLTVGCRIEFSTTTNIRKIEAASLYITMLAHRHTLLTACVKHFTWKRTHIRQKQVTTRTHKLPRKKRQHLLQLHNTQNLLGSQQTQQM